MPRLNRIALSHFRSHKSWSIEVDGRPVALFGPNGAGKTNILEAISMLSPGRGLRRAQPDELIRRPERIGWKISAVVEGDAGASEIVTAVGEPGARRSVEIDGKAAPQTALGAAAPMVWLTPAMDRLWLEGAAERRRFIDRAALTFEPGHGDRALAYEKSMRERNRLLKDGVRDAAWLAALEAQMAKAGAGVARARAETIRRLTAAQDDAAGAFPGAKIAMLGDAENRFAEVIGAGGDPRAEEDAVEASLAAAFADGRGADERAGRTLSGPHRSDLHAVFAPKGVEARLCSTGEQKALLISLILATARAFRSETGATPMILLDEVAAHLDEGRRAALFDEVTALGAQAWMTGAGAELFGTLGERGTLVGI